MSPYPATETLPDMDENSVRNATDIGQAPPPQDYRRAYKACFQCRRAKAKCELSPKQKICLKCAREQRECRFPEQRSSRKNERRVNSSSSHQTRRAGNSPRVSHDLGQIGVHSTATERSSFDTARPNLQLLHQPPTLSSVYGRSGIQSNTKQNRQDLPPRETTGRQKADANLHDEIVRTVMSSSNDARNMLFKVASQHDSSDSEDEPVGSLGVSPASALTSDSKSSLPFVTLSHITKEDTELWSQQRFVRQGWFTAQEAVTYINLGNSTGTYISRFFQNLLSLSPVLASVFADHRSHKHLIIEEPLLCCTILMISSRYHILPGYHGTSRAEFVHMRLWKYCEHLVHRITLGAEKYCTARTRTLGSIHALLLITEWHPRAVRFPPETDGWDHSLAPSIDDSYGHPHGSVDSNSARWREEVFEPAKRSDRMSWSLIGLAITLAHELGVFEDTGAEIEPLAVPQMSRLRCQRLLFLYVHQLTLRLGCTSIFPQACQLSETIQMDASVPAEGPEYYREVILCRYISITKLLKAITDTCFHISIDPRGIGTVRMDALTTTDVPDSSKQLLLIEYYYAIMYLNSLGIQAFVERVSRGQGYHVLMDTNEIHHSFNNAVREASCEILSIVIQLGESGCLRYCPVRVFVRLVAASMFLLKSLSLGPRNNMLRSLEVLDKCNQTLRENQHDDVHLSTRYGKLIDRLVRRFKKNMLSQSGFGISKPATPEPEGARPPRQQTLGPT
ncbi:hypothetical protein N7519_001369 [Penicillium mononematosum]|uniref:uncharacterized protein n=1 Tax=Penicillium mononematosum TaxID=268346 RepID=UPI0025473873|nr:uncharacterized protein N7519_001369 [Penicillium mononematosum]KAJ6191348.1 hypothetical protein N7519_001369 [Penicillium mononematosum]